MLIDSSPLRPFIPRSKAQWQRRQVIHLLRCTTFDVNTKRVNELIQLFPSDAVDLIVDEALSTSTIPKPHFAEIGDPPSSATSQEKADYAAILPTWRVEFNRSLSMCILSGGLQGKLTLFWHSHFATEYTIYSQRPQFAYRYIKLIQDHALGDFKAFTIAMGLTSAMLIYLNGNLNRRGTPNENYARELFELFTLGEGNGYTQTDIQEMAKALTGYTVNYSTLTVSLNPSRIDNSVKLIFGKNDAFTYETAHEQLFEVRSELIASHICRKLYRFFVHATPDEEVVAAMAEIFLANNFQVEPVLRALFKSEHFFAEERMGAMVASPYDLMGQLMNAMAIPRNQADANEFLRIAKLLGFEILEPPNVAGWPGHRAWLDTSLLITRWDTIATFLNRYPTHMLDFGKSLPDNADAYKLAAHIAELFLAVPLSEEDKRNLGDVLLSGIPVYEWNVNGDGALTRLQGLMAYIMTLPEYQLN